MTATVTLLDLPGRWIGRMELWFEPSAAALSSDATAEIRLVADARFLMIGYTWSHEGRPQDGHLMLRLAGGLDDVEMIWVDSFHQGGAFMRLAGETKSADRAVARGSYAAAPDPDWGWRIAVTAETADRCRIAMENISPDDAAMRAVAITLDRVR